MSETLSCPTCGGPRRRGDSRTNYPKFCSEVCRPRCTVPGCERPWRKFVEGAEVCSMHYTRHRRAGEFGIALPIRELSAGGACRNCGKTMGQTFEMRGWLCSVRCAWRWHTRTVSEGDSWPCVSCEAPIYAFESRVDTLYCDTCAGSKRGRPKPAMTALEIALRDGELCMICHMGVDVSISGLDPLGPTADHIIPLSLGGENVPENLQLAHRTCNSRKGNRVARVLSKMEA